MNFSKIAVLMDIIGSLEIKITFIHWCIALEQVLP